MNTKSNETLLAEKLSLFNQTEGPRVGDFIRLPAIHPRLGQWTRITHDWGDHLQTGGLNGSYFLYGTCASYSGSLDIGVKRKDLIPTSETRDGSCWFFDQDQAGAGRGVYFKVPFRVFALREGADLSGIDELRCPYSVLVLDQKQHENTCNYWFLVHHFGGSHTAFNKKEQLIAWLKEKGLKLTKPLTEAGTFSSQTLAYV